MWRGIAVTALLVVRHRANPLPELRWLQEFEEPHSMAAAQGEYSRHEPTSDVCRAHIRIVAQTARCEHCDACLEHGPNLTTRSIGPCADRHNPPTRPAGR